MAMASTHNLHPSNRPSETPTPSSNMELRLVNVPFEDGILTDELYEHALRCVDSVSQKKIRRFFKRPDSWRTLVGRLLIRVLLKEIGVASSSISLGATEEGKLFIASPNLTPYLSFNITHDSALVGMVYQRGDDKADVDKIGVDVMKVALPRRETVPSFIGVLRDQLSPLEKSLLAPSTPPLSSDETLKRIFWLWTLKEAYTKALGIGLGFDFSRVEFNFLTDEVKVDGKPARGWEFRLFSLGLPVEAEGRGSAVVVDGMDLYQGVVARWVGGEECTVVRSPFVPRGVGQWHKMVNIHGLIRRADVLESSAAPADLESL